MGSHSNVLPFLMSVPRCAKTMLETTLRAWEEQGAPDLWLFAYGSLIWKADFPIAERHSARVHGYHRALRMWSRINRGTPEVPGLVFALLSGGSCQGMALRIPKSEVRAMLPDLWEREMPRPVYDPKWLRCQTAAHGPLTALAFTLSRSSPNYTGRLNQEQLCQIFKTASGRFGSTLDYARQTHEHLLALGIRDAALEQALQCMHEG